MPAARASRPRFVAGFEPRLTGDDDLYLLREWGGDDVLVEGDGRFAADLLELADGSRDLTSLEAALLVRHPDRSPEDVARAVEALEAAGAVEALGADRPPLPDDVAERFDRQLAYFAQLGLEEAGAQRRLAEASVCVLGLGGLGSWTAYALACCGVGSITGVDGDAVELSNLNRQVLYTEADVGRPKARAAGRALRTFDGALAYTGVERRLASAEDVAAAVAGADVVVAAADWPPHRIDRWVDRACFAAGIPYLSISQQPPLVRVGPFYIPGATGCYHCLEAGYRERFALYDVIAQAAQPFAPAATFGPACGVVGSLAASEVVHLLAGAGTPATAGAALLLDTRTFVQQREVVDARPGCPTCTFVEVAQH